MKQLGDVLLSPSGFSEIMMGNHAILRAMIEEGVRVITSYPGSPTPEIAEAIHRIPREKRPFYFEFSVNEKVATEIAFGASVNGHLSTVFFKSVGLNVAADTFVQLAHLELTGGMVIILGDDPGANSSQNEQDNRHYAALAYTPVLEPASPNEAYEMYKEAARLSKEKRMPVILRLTTHVCHCKEKIDFSPWVSRHLDDTPAFDTANGPYVPITARVFPLKRKALGKLRDMLSYNEKSRFNRVIDNGNRERGIITAGMPFLSLLDVLEESASKPDILKIGTVHPLPEAKISEFLASHKEIKVLEELDDVMERAVKVIAFDRQIAVKIKGKLELEDWVGEYTPGKVHDIMRRTWPDCLPAEVPRAGQKPAAPARPPQLCPGCGHRPVLYAVKKALNDRDITVGDIGCHSLCFFPPYQIGELILCMGHSTATASGLSLFNRERRVLAFIGDSTFFHAGMPAIVNALFNRHNVTLVVMENGTTAMTGHQDHPGSGRNFNDLVDRIPIKKVLEGFGAANIREIDTYNVGKLVEMIKETMAEEGFRIIIARHPCMLKFTRERKKKGTASGRAVVNQEHCTRIHECVEVFGCPSFQRDKDGSTWVTGDLCIGDGSCLAVCPAGALELKKPEEV